MKNLFWLILLLPLTAFGQAGARYENHPSMKQRADGALVPTAATIAVCTQPANTGVTPCTPLATLYTDATLATPCTGTNKDGSLAGATNCSNPLVTDSKGNYHFYAPVGHYTLQVSGSGLTTSFEPDVNVPCDPSGNCTIVGNVTETAGQNTYTAYNFDGDFWVDGNKYATCAAAVTAAGTTNQAWIEIPARPTNPIDCPSGAMGSATTGGISNIIVHNKSRNDWCNPAYHGAGAPCSAVNYGYDDGNVATVEKHQSSISTSHNGGASLGAYFLSWLVNGSSPAAGQMDGISAEANSWGTLTGTWARMVAAEQNNTVYSSGGTITAIDAVEGYVNTNSALSSCTPATTCTQVGTVIGGHFWGARTIGGAAPTNSYAVYAESSANKASGRNYSLAGVGRNLILYDTNIGTGALQFEDAATNARTALYVDSSSTLQISAINATGLLLQDNTQSNQLGVSTSGTRIFNKVYNYNGTATAGIGTIPVYGATSQKSESAADANVLTFTPPAAAGTYRLSFVLSLSAANTATLGWTATWKDSNAAAQAPTNMSLFQTGVAAPALTFTTSAVANYYGSAVIDIDSSATNIVIKLTFSGTSFTGKASATIERIQ